MYRVVTDEQVSGQIDSLPVDALSPLAELRALLEIDPWSGNSINDLSPDAPVRTLTFGPDHQGIAAYLILEAQRRVDLVRITWMA